MKKTKIPEFMLETHPGIYEILRYKDGHYEAWREKSDTWNKSAILPS